VDDFGFMNFIIAPPIVENELRNNSQNGTQITRNKRKLSLHQHNTQKIMKIEDQMIEKMDIEEEISQKEFTKDPLFASHLASLRRRSN